MRRDVASLALLASAIMGVACAAASAPSTNPRSGKTVATETQIIEPSPDSPSATGSTSRRHLFPVNDAKGLLLTCIAPEIETNTDTDLFTDCTLAPGRTLDDVMHSFVAALHYVQKEQMKERAESGKDLEERKSGKAAQK